VQEHIAGLVVQLQSPFRLRRLGCDRIEDAQIPQRTAGVPVQGHACAHLAEFRSLFEDVDRDAAAQAPQGSRQPTQAGARNEDQSVALVHVRQ
jgi:hypothetical protein